MAEKLQMVVNTIQGLEIRATEENMSHLLACIQVLRQVIMEIQEPAEKKESEG